MSAADILIIIFLALLCGVIVFTGVRSLLRAFRGKGRSSCGGNCGSCGSCGRDNPESGSETDEK